MAYDEITNGEIDGNSPITEPLLTKFRDNLAGAFNKDAGAPVLANDYIVAAMIPAGEIGQSEIATAAVSQSELKTATEELTTTSTSTSNMETLAGGEYCFIPVIRIANAAAVCWMLASGSNTQSTSYVSVLGLYTSNGSYTAFARSRYVSASGPYDLGDGIIQLFVFATILSDGTIESLHVAIDPPWAYNGITSIMPDHVAKDGKKYQRHILLPNEQMPISKRMLADRFAAAIKNPQTLDRFIEDANDASYEMIEIDQAIKNADMPLIPHPFTSNDNSSKTIVMLDPFSPAVLQIAELHDMGFDNVSDLIRDNLVIGNIDIGRSPILGVITVSANWKLTP